MVRLLNCKIAALGVFNIALTFVLDPLTCLYFYCFNARSAIVANVHIIWPNFFHIATQGGFSETSGKRILF